MEQREAQGKTPAETPEEELDRGGYGIELRNWRAPFR